MRRDRPGGATLNAIGVVRKASYVKIDHRRYVKIDHKRLPGSAQCLSSLIYRFMLYKLCVVKRLLVEFARSPYTLRQRQPEEMNPACSCLLDQGSEVRLPQSE